MLYSMQISAVKNPVDYVSTLVGTQSKFELSTGNTYPATALPWGMNFWTPQTGKMGDGWAYTYDADKIRGFKQTHQPSPWMNDYGQFSIMPITGGLVFDQDQRASWFSHKAEVAKPYYYKVYLADHDVTTELVPTERAVMFRFTYPETKNAYVVIDAFDKGSYVKVIPEENKIIGYSTKNSGGVPENFKNYFVIQFDKPFTFTSGVKENNILPNETEVQGNHSGALISELCPGTVPEARRFLIRNRLIAALSSTLIVAQARARSGALNTAGWANELNRRVFAVPGDVTMPHNTGCNRLIQEGQASIICSLTDIDEFCHAAHRPQSADAADNDDEPSEESTDTSLSQPTNATAAILKAIRTCSAKYGHVSTDGLLAILAESNPGEYSISRISMELGLMELNGLICTQHGNITITDASAT